MSGDIITQLSVYFIACSPPMIYFPSVTIYLTPLPNLPSLYPSFPLVTNHLLSVSMTFLSHGLLLPCFKQSTYELSSSHMGKL